MYDFDHGAFLALNFDGGSCMDRLMLTVSGTAMWLPLYALILWLVWRRGGWRNVLLFTVLMLAALALSDMVAGIFKHNGLLGGALPDFAPRPRDNFHRFAAVRYRKHGDIVLRHRYCGTAHIAHILFRNEPFKVFPGVSDASPAGHDKVNTFVSDKFRVFQPRLDDARYAPRVGGDNDNPWAVRVHRREITAADFLKEIHCFLAGCKAKPFRSIFAVPCC